MEDQWTRSSEGDVGCLWVYRNPEYAIYLRHIPPHENGMWVEWNIIGYRLLNDSLVVIHTVCVDVNSSPIAKYRYSNPSSGKHCDYRLLRKVYHTELLLLSLC